VLMENRGAVDGVGFEHLVGFGLHFVLQRRGGTGGVWTSFSTPALEDLRYWQPCLVPRSETPSSAAAGAGAGAFAGAAMVVPPHAGPAAPQPSASAACAARSRAGGPEPSEAHAAPAKPAGSAAAGEARGIEDDESVGDRGSLPPDPLPGPAGREEDFAQPPPPRQSSPVVRFTRHGTDWYPVCGLPVELGWCVRCAGGVSAARWASGKAFAARSISACCSRSRRRPWDCGGSWVAARL
jgi:hypothetical protein